jgi:hypothetical protein
VAAWKKEDPLCVSGSRAAADVEGRGAVAAVEGREQSNFDEIDNSGSLDRSKPFEYRDLILRMIRADSYIGLLISPAGAIPSVYRRVVSEIVGRSSKD